MPTYPTVTINGTAIPSSDRRINLDKTSPVRQANLPGETFTPGSGQYGRVVYPSPGPDFPLFGVTLMIIGQGSTWDDRIADCEATADQVAMLCTLREKNDLVFFPSSAQELRAEATIVSIERQNTPRDHAIFNIVFRLLWPFWKFPTASTYTHTPTDGTQTITLGTDFVCSAPIFGATFDITGPCSSMKITDAASGITVFYNNAVVTGKVLHIETWPLRAWHTDFTGLPDLKLSVYDNNPIRSTVALPRKFRITNQPLTTGAATSAWRAQLDITTAGTSAATRLAITGYRAYR